MNTQLANAAVDLTDVAIIAVTPQLATAEFPLCKSSCAAAGLQAHCGLSSPDSTKPASTPNPTPTVIASSQNERPTSCGARSDWTTLFPSSSCPKISRRWRARNVTLTRRYGTSPENGTDQRVKRSA